jgi:16S rRNA (adenine1518-N6/adenine1519-N6)-dimethyltransferase
MIFAKKSLGQNFLKSERALSSIIEAAQISPNETILEIGPGQGALTKKLLEAGAKVIAVEKDDQLFEILKGEIQSENFKIIHQDILEYDPSEIPQSYKVVANIPYNITGAILEKFLSDQHQPQQMVLLVQKEVAERIVSRDEKESILSISVKAYGVPRYIEKVLAGSFVPAPRVDSAIVSIEGISKNFFTNFSEKGFFALLKAGFSSKRKKLLSNLSNLYPKENVGNAFKRLNLSENTRAEEVNVEKWGELASIILN